MTIKPSGDLTILQKEVRLGDPHVNSDDRNNLSILFSMYESLIAFGDKAKYVPALAEKWTLEKDARTWTFHLRKDVKFHNGDTLSADDVIASLDRVLDPSMGGELGTKSIYNSYLGDAKYVALDNNTIKMVTAEPMADLLDLLVKFPIAPRNALSGLPEIPVGSGPYRFSSMEDNRIELEAFLDYWKGKPPVDRITWIGVSSADERIEALLSGKADIIADVSPAGYKKINETAGFQTVTSPSSVCTIFMLNIQKGVCMDRRVRQALNYALDNPSIIEDVMDGFATPLNGPLAQMHLGFDPETPTYPYDPEKAKTLLAEAGYKDGMKLTIDVPTILPDEATELAKVMKNQYENIGIQTEVKEFSDRPAYAEMVRDKKIDDACAFDSSPLSTYQIFIDKFHSGLHGAWWQGYSNKDVDELINQARATPDVAKRQALYQKAYRILKEDAPWIYLHNETLIWGLSEKMRGWTPPPDGLIKLVD